jgi:hypothetical protein
MLPVQENVAAFLKQVLIFNEFTEDELVEIAKRLNKEYIQAGESVFQQGDARDNVYMIQDGEVLVTRLEKDGSETFLANFDYADLFGEDALIFERSRSATVTAVKDTELFYLSEADFNWLRTTYPKVNPYIIAFSQTHETVRKLKIKWLSEEETISLATKRHPIRLIFELAAIAFIMSLTITISVALITFLSNVMAVTILASGIAGFVTLLGLVAGIWSFMDWRNDYFFVTNIRVVWRERMLLRSSSRQEVPLRTIQSLRVQTPNVLARMIHIGDVIIKTFNSEMRLTDVNNPDRMVRMIDAFLLKARRRSTRSEHAAIRQTIRRQLGYQQEDEEQAKPLEQATLPVQSERRRLTIFQTRIVENGTFTYRKHWWLFLKRAWKSTLALLASSAVIIGITGNILRAFGPTGLVLLYFIPFCIFLWWLYEYADWRNDIYRVTKDRIIDRDKKPFGKESFRSAPINNIQSVGHEIPNTLGLILNVGDVKINVGDETLTFDGVHNPALVHQDISRRMEELATETEQARSAQEHALMATWLDIYHDETKGEFDTGPVEHIPDFD